MKFPGAVAGFMKKNLKTEKCKLKEDVNFLDQQGIHSSVVVKIYFQTGYLSNNKNLMETILLLFNNKINRQLVGQHLLPAYIGQQNSSHLPPWP